MAFGRYDDDVVVVVVGQVRGNGDRQRQRPKVLWNGR